MGRKSKLRSVVRSISVPPFTQLLPVFFSGPQNAFPFIKMNSWQEKFLIPGDTVPAVFPREIFPERCGKGERGQWSGSIKAGSAIFGFFTRGRTGEGGIPPAGEG